MPAHHLHARHAQLHQDHGDVALEERAALPEPEANPDVKTVISVVYYTAPKTFDGPAVYVTDPLNVPSATATAAHTSAKATQVSVESNGNDDDDDDDSTSASQKSTGTTLATQTVKASKSAATTDASASASDSSSSQITAAASLASSGSLAQASTISSAASASSTAAASGDGGMSGGAKAGLAFGIIALLALIAFGVMFARKKQANNKGVPADDEKFNEKHVPTPAPAPMANGNMNNSANSMPGSMASRAPSVKAVKTHGNAPRLSLRPMTQFNPMAPKGEGDVLDTPVGASVWEKRGAANAANDPANPFGNHAETVDGATARDAVELLTPTTPQSPSVMFPPPVKVAPTSAPTSDPMPGAAMTTSKAVPAPPEILRPGSVASIPKTNSMSSDVSGTIAMGAVAVSTPTHVQSPFADAMEVPPSPGPAPTGSLPVPNGAPAQGAALPVHRVQMDFTPSMGDELDVKIGQLVRMKHEYDDGWALCERMDRSKQGVVPRSCLSKQALKARPNGPPGPNGRPMSPASGRNSPRPMSPAQGPRPMSPAQGPRQGPRQGSPQGRSRAQSNAAFAGQPRPMPPAGGPPRAMSPAGGRPRAPSNVGAQPRPMSPMNPSPMNPNGGRQRSQSNASFTQPRPQFAQDPRPRANSTGQVSGRTTPPGPSPMNPSQAPAAAEAPAAAPAPAPVQTPAALPQRKPVPGQSSVPGQAL